VAGTVTVTDMLTGKTEVGKIVALGLKVQLAPGMFGVKLHARVTISLNVPSAVT
jgi:hypothetical protein